MLGIPLNAKEWNHFTPPKREIATITAENWIKQALCTKLPPATRYNIKPGHNVLIYREKEKERMAPDRVARICEKEVFVDWEGKEKHFNLTQVLPMLFEQGDRELKGYFRAWSNSSQTHPLWYS